MKPKIVDMTFDWNKDWLGEGGVQGKGKGQQLMSIFVVNDYMVGNMPK